VGQNGVRYFAAEEIEAVFVRVRRSIATEHPRTDDTAAAEAFAMFRDGKDPADVVRQLGVEPEVVEQLFKAWARFQQTILLQGAQLEALRRLFPGQALVNERALVDAVGELRSISCFWCERCRAHPPYYCLDCARDAGVRAFADEDVTRLF
ncbi:MAG: hypothetical protein ACOY0T_20235, partial [Myxococcota bacterium]